MSKARLDQLRGAVDIFYRSTQDLSGGKGKLWFDDHEGFPKIIIKLYTSGTEEKPIELTADTITFIKTKDYADKTNNAMWVLAVGVVAGSLSTANAVERVCTRISTVGEVAAETTQHTFQFSEREIRDMWEHCLRTLATESAAGAAKDAEVKVVPSKFRPIQALALQQPPAGILVSIRIELETSEEPAILEIAEANTDSDACKRLTNQFIDDHHVLPTENTSLYRYIRSVVQRALMERETTVIIHEISMLHFDKLMDSDKFKEIDKNSSKDIDRMVTMGDEDLTRLTGSIPARIGQHGSGATVVNTILKRNVEKMKLINSLAAQKYVKVQLAGGAAA